MNGTVSCNMERWPIPVTVVVPLYNEAEGIGHLATSLRRLEKSLRSRYVMHVLLVDDGSQDDTIAAVNRHFASWPNVEVIQHPTNYGVARAILTGLRAASTEFVCSLDADCTYDPAILEPMLHFLEQGADLVTASPYHPEGQVGQVPPWRLALSRGASALYRGVLGVGIHTFTSCCRAYRRSAILELPLRRDGFEGIAELLARVVLEGGKVVEQPAVLDVRRHGQSKLRLLRTIGRHCGLLAELAAIRLLRVADPIIRPKRLIRHAGHPLAPRRHGHCFQTRNFLENHSP